ncbi:hypothetical protein AT727_02485 [Desulfitobacterium hafniense]|uniref:Glycosyltransferase 2-like domain-containing protein n=1 Tax=Desulfitobacterium hafniense TaxID=49338 RepID=A0A0W1JQN7_DESHA|nr:glycosyltransferase [Desulfitobacterium hafniense]KTE93842.1 hypothetical protein AT727_02485 [Desulfitobacterium hafniense]
MNRISVIVLSYNNLPLLTEALDSVMMQDYSDWELILSDDGSNDFCLSKVEKYIKDNVSKNCKRVVVYTNEHNLGTVKNLNKAISYSQGSYIVPIAADDVFYDSSVLSRFAEIFAQNMNKFILTSQVALYDNKLINFIDYTLVERDIKLLKEEDFSQIFGELCLHSFLPAGGTAYRKEVFGLYGLFDENYRLVEDWPFSLKMARLGVPYHYCDFISLKHRDGGVSHNSTRSSTQRVYQTDLLRIIEKEILPYVAFAPDAMQEKIRIRCMDKKLIYSLRYELQEKGIWQKCQWFLTNKNFLQVLFRGLKRRMLGNE